VPAWESTQQQIPFLSFVIWRLLADMFIHNNTLNQSLTLPRPMAEYTTNNEIVYIHIPISLQSL
jgi:hypothetical protein